MNKEKLCGDSDFSMDYALINDIVMQKIRNRKLNLSAIKVYLYLSRNRDLRTGTLHGTKIKAIADYWCMSIRAVRYAIQDLIEAELYIPPMRTGIETIEGVLLPKKGDS